MDNFNVSLRGEGVFLPNVIQTKNPIKEEITISELYNLLSKVLKKKLHPSYVLYIYVITQDDFCGFIPLPNQTMGELAKIYGNNGNLIVKITEKPLYG
jgi:hypothetical protein